jgi:predicted transcriptional regulator
MITIQLDEAKQQRLERLATSTGQDVSQLVRHIVDEYLDAQVWCKDSAEDWAAASVALTPEFLAGESWDDGDTSHEPR